MESMRDINRVMEREIAKGSCPLKLDHIEFGNYSYQEITSKEKLLEMLSYLLRIGDFKQYAGKTILNNVYMDLRGKKPVFKRTKTAIERNNIFATIKRYAKKLKLQYNGDVYLEMVRCYFDIPQENLEKCRYTYQGNETYVFLILSFELSRNTLRSRSSADITVSSESPSVSALSSAALTVIPVKHMKHNIIPITINNFLFNSNNFLCIIMPSL